MAKQKAFILYMTHGIHDPPRYNWKLIDGPNSELWEEGSSITLEGLVNTIFTRTVAEKHQNFKVIFQTPLGRSIISITDYYALATYAFSPEEEREFMNIWRALTEQHKEKIAANWPVQEQGAANARSG